MNPRTEPDLAALLDALPSLRRGLVRFDAFMCAALYAPGFGYYLRERRRVGRSRDADFFTASSVGEVFGELVCAACASLLGSASPGDYTFVELGAEPGLDILQNVSHPFGATRVVRVNEALDLRGNCIVFSNELFDAQPFRRWRRGGTGWQECHVALQDSQLCEVWAPLAELPPGVTLPDAPEGYQLDVSWAARELAHAITAQPWQGLFVAFDYGKSWRVLSEDTPQGTLRAYRQHRQSNDLLATPGRQDLTGHVCWDWITDALTRSGFHDVSVESQEAFFVKRASGHLSQLLASSAGQFSGRKQAILQLIHPGNMGQKFQVLCGRRG